jgi:hypothetical protein
VSAAESAGINFALEPFVLRRNFHSNARNVRSEKTSNFCDADTTNRKQT